MKKCFLLKEVHLNTKCNSNELLQFIFSETKFIGSPNALREEDGVIVTLWSPLKKENKPLMHILDPMSLSVIAELELPVAYLPIGIHGLFFDYEE
jgi:carotenoid cleavage dioxygenase-like enzyme